MDASGFGRKKSGGLSDTGAGIPVLARLAWLCQLRSLHMQDARVFQTMVAIHHPFRSFVWKEMVGDPGIEPGVRLREGVTVPCHTLRPVAHCQALHLTWRRDYKRAKGASTGKNRFGAGNFRRPRRAHK